MKTRQERIDALRDAGFEDLAQTVEEVAGMERLALLALLDMLCKRQQREIRQQEGKC